MIKPLPGYILVEPIKEETQQGGIYLPEDVNDKPCKGRVIGVCDFYISEPVSVVAINKETQDFINQGWKKDPTMANSLIQIAYKDIIVGTIVIFKKWTNQEVKFEGKDYLLVKFEELLATL